MRKKLPKKLLFLILFLFFVFKANAQYATSHYIAPSPWQYWSDANEIVLTTESTTAVTVTLKKSDGTFLATRTLTSAAPDVYRFVGSPWLLNSNPVNTIQDDRGLIVESIGGKVSVNLRNVASDQASSGGGDTTGATIKGNASLVSFGNEGRGTSFRLGYYRSIFTGIAGFNGAANRPVYSVMAIDDNTQVKLNGANLVLLNKGQSYLFQPNGTGDLLEANKPVVANTGAYTDTPGGCGDGAVDQMAPISILGNRYIVIRGSGTAGTGTNLPEQSTIIATEPNTTVTVDNYRPDGTFINRTTFPLAAGGFRSIHHGDANNRYSSSIIESDKPIAVYSGTAQSCEVDIATVLPVGGCSGSKWTSTSQFKGYIQQVLPYFGFVLVESATAPVYVNGLNIETTTTIPRFQLGSTGVYLIRFENTQIGNPANITVNSAARMNVGIVQQGGGFSMSGFFSSFNETPALPDVTKDSNGCAINIITADPGLEPYQWYLDGVLIPGATSQSIVPLKTGNYSITGTRDCGVTGKSAAIYVAVCGDREVTKTVANGSAANEVVFTVAAKNNGPNEDRNVVVTDALPSGYTFVSASPSTGTYDQSTGIWNIGNLAVNAAAALNITATIKTTGGVTNTASIKGDNIDLTLTNDSDNATPQAELKLVKTARTGVFNKAGDVITYDLVVTNTGKVPVFNINITDANADSGSISPALVTTLLPGASTNSTATHTVTLADLIAGKVINSAEAKGVDGSNNPVEDISGTAADNDTETETETKSVIFADNDTVNAINGNTGATNVINIFANDNINGNSFVPAAVVVTLGTSGVPAGLTLNTDGSIDVAVGTSAGTYTFDYKICQVDIPLNCADATVTVIVNTIDATNDTPSPINGTTGGTIPTVFANDTLDGVAFLPADVTLTTSTTLPTGLTLNSDGTITVDANTAPGTYPITYNICQVANPLICDTATTTVVVTTIDATNDTPAPINGTTGGTIPTVFANDTLDGVAFLPADVTLTTSTTLPTGLTLNSDGTITVDANTAPGTYPITYSICQVANPLICDTATTTVIVTTINADNDTPSPINGTTGGTIPTVFANDTLDGVAFLPADVTLTTSTTLPTGLTLNSDGTITVDANTAPGTYPITYNICQVANPLICDTATTTVVVTTIDATNDTPAPINGTTGGTIPTVFANDTLDGVAFLPADVTLTTSTTLPTGLTLNSDGTITVDANTAPGTYPVNYSICQVANPLICDTATTTVIVTTINADNDTPSPINGTTGGTIPTVFANDTLDGVAFLPADVTLTTSTTLPTGLTLNSDGTITVDANTAPGTYPITYSICQVANPLICDTATTTVIVTTIDATNDTPAPINGTTGGTIPTVFANDTLDGVAFLPADVTLTTSTALPTGLTLNSDGTITVDANTTPGTYPITYSICQVANPLICDTATTTVIVTTIDATNDTPAPINGTTGGTIPTVFANDTLDGVAFLPADVTLTTSTTLPTGLTLNSDGTITVDANTTPGTYPITYSICQVANPSICDTATTTVVVTTIDATNDTPAPINGTTGGTIPTVFANDTLDGVAFLSADVTLTTSTTLPTGLTLNSDGTITVDANTTPGTYPITYSICQVANPLICDTATTTVIVTTINADNDTPSPINGTTGGTIPTVFANDTLDGVAFLPADVTLTTSTTLPTGLTLNSDGTITVDANTTPGTYPVTYSICQVANPLICDTATTTVIVTTIDATNDTPAPINGTTGGTIPTVFANDTLDGVAFLPADVTLTTSTTLPTGLTLNSDGTITVDANTAPGTYPITYSICQVANPLICDTATTTVIVTTIDATNDTPAPINGTTGGTIPTVFANDTLDGVAFLPADVTLTTSTTLPTGLTLNSDGTITVDANTAPGTYPITYSICQVANPLICDTATTTVIVTTINADNDTPSPINGTTGGTIPTVFANDTLDGVAFLPADVTLTTSTTLPTGLTLNSDGTITVDANTTPGTYPVTYSICQVANPLICDTATTTVIVTTIDATNDTPAPINGTTGGTIPTVFANDTLDGVAFLPADVTLTTSTTLPTGLTLNSDGTITVDANTAPGTYPITYSICQVANPLICDTATTTVIVTTIDATNDTPAPINGTTGGTIPTVFANDTLDGVAFLPADVTLTTSTTLPTGLTLNSDGTITVDANTAPGSYPITYSICQVANPLICDTATTTVVVTTIDADNDTPAPINGTTGGTIPTVFTNDTLDGVAFLPADVTLTTSTTLPTGLTLNSDGTITVDANTAPGSYPITYSICQVANPLICDTATTTVVVTTIDADNDTPAPINGTTGGTIPTVFANDTLDGVSFLPADVTLTTSTTLPTGLTLNSDGTITVDANTVPGNYPITYSICQVANPLICDTAITTVIITTIDATADTPAPINGTTGGTIPTVFTNDTLDGVAFLPADVTLTTSTTLPTGLTLNSDGTITVDANTVPGNYPITYSICQVANPLICDTATTTVIVTTIDATNDTPAPINGTTGGTIPTVFTNDTLDGVAFLPADVTLTTSTTLPTGLTLNSDGTITVDANTVPGNYPITYSICQVANPLICDTATTTVIVTTIDATNDTPAPINGTTGGTIPTVFANDTLDGVAFLPADVTLTTSTTLPTGLTLNSDGTITVDANTAPGTYPITYSICQVANPLICDTATTTVVVTTIDADNDTPSPINGTTGGTIPTVFANDTLDGLPFLPADVTLTTSTALPTGLTLNSDGTITVDANTVPGTYPITYSICQKANPTICDEATINVIVQVPTIEVIKKGTFNDANGDGFAQKGETITYNFSVVNTGTMQLTNVVVTDPMVTVTGGPIAVLNVGTKDDTTFSATYVITQADVDAGAINNQALVTATPIVGTPISNLSDSNDPALPGKNDPTITKLFQNPGLKLLKHGIFEDANHDGSVSEGDRINYVFRVINTGNVTIKDIVVTDPMVTVTGGPISLEPLAFDTTTFTASYVLTQSDIDLGAVYNLAMVTGNDPNGVSIDNDSEDISPLTPQDKFYEPTCPTCTVTILEQKSGIALVKTAVFNDENNNKNAEAGETITYSFVVTNTGNVRLTNVVINDPLPGIVMTGGPISLSPGESDNTSFKGIYTLKQSDINAGKVSNQAFVTAKNALGVTVSDASDDNDNTGNNPTVSQIEGCVIKIFNAMSPNGDTKNERFYIQGIECYPDNTVEIYNRWGVLVFERENYNNEERAFRGISEGRTTVKQSDGLPVGTYYYILKYKDSDSNAHQEAGYLYLSK